MQTLTNVGTAYDSTSVSKGIGGGRIDFTGVTQVVFDVRVSKVGVGIQSWQLWNETDGTQIGVIDDAGLIGDKTLTATFQVALSGEKLVRIRCKSTVASDDPIFYYGSIFPK